MSDYIIGLTGGIASGKSTVARCFEALQVTVIDADVAARDVVAPGSDGLAAIVSAFGPGVLTADGGLDRAAMRQRIFEDDDARSRMEAIVHPLVRVALQTISAAAHATYALVAIPLLAEGGGRQGYPWLDRILVIDAPVDAQIARLLQRDAVDSTLAARMIAAQARRRARLAIADDVLVNNGGFDALAAQVAALDAQYRALAAVRG